MYQARVPPANREMGTQPAPSIPSHDDARFRHRLADRFVGQHAGPIEVELVVNDDIFTQHCHVLHAHLGGRGRAWSAGQDAFPGPPPPGPGPRLTHWPTRQRQPTMQDSSQEWERMRAPRSTVHRRMHTPSSTTTPGPRLTLGPMLQLRPMWALGS